MSRLVIYLFNYLFLVTYLLIWAQAQPYHISAFILLPFHLTFLWNKKVKWNLTGSFQDFKSPLLIWSKLNLLLKRLAFFDLSFLLTFATRNQPVIGIDFTKRKASSTYQGMIPSTWCYDKQIVRPSYYYLYLYSTQWSNLKNQTNKPTFLKFLQR